MAHRSTLSRARGAAPGSSAGTAACSPNVEVDLGAPDALVLHGNFPNPFRVQTTVRYELPPATHVQMDVYNVLGQRVITLINERQAPGRRRSRLTQGR